MTAIVEAPAVPVDESGVTAYASLWLKDFGGYFKQQVAIIGETPKKYRILALKRTRLSGRYRYLERGETALVPKTALRAIVAREK